ncbi:MAG: ExeM/NucH family extracellular endonuclease [Woeseia sp.]
MRIVILISLLVVAAAGCGGGGGAAVVIPPPPGPVVTPIHEVQGSGRSSPVNGQAVSVRGIVTGDFQDGDADAQNDLGGFYLQEEMPDADPATSEGVFVSDGASPAVDVNVGDRVTVEGTVSEFSRETRVEATSVRVDAVAAAVIPATDVNLPAAGTVSNADREPIADLERLEGMLVRFPQTLSVTNLFELERYGEVLLSQGGRLRQFTNGNAPDVAGNAAHGGQAAARSVMLDDGLTIMNAAPVRYLDPAVSTTPGYSVRAGDGITNLTGNVRYSRGSGVNGAETYRLVPTAGPQFVPANPRPAAAPNVGGTLRVASFNVLNFFTTIDTGQNICGPSGDRGCRGADSQQEFDRQRGKIVTALIALDADIVGLMELENNATAALQSLVNGLNAAAGAGSYAFVDTGTIGSDAIRVGLLYRPASVAAAGTFAILDSTVDPRFDDARNRPVLAQSFTKVANGAILTVAVNHLKSKGSSCSSVGDPDLNDGQGNCNATRTGAAAALADWLAGDPTASGDPDVLIIGDLNAYLQEDPVTTLEAAGYDNLLENFVGPGSYSFVFAGQAGALDHALASASLVSQVSGVAEWHINADEPAVLDYNLEFGRDPAIFDGTTPYRASDHDPVVVGLNPSP